MRKRPTIRLVSQQSVAVQLRLSPRQVQNLVLRGMPVVRLAGKPPQYDMDRVWAWYADWKVTERQRRRGSGTEREARTRLFMAQAALRQLDIHVRRGDLVPMDALEGATRRMLAQLRAAVLSTPGKWAPAIASCQSAAQVGVVLDRAMTEVAAALSVKPVTL